MSLDVYLMEETVSVPVVERIFVQRGGATVEVTREEWESENPGVEPVALLDDEDHRHEVYWSNITHNMGAMASECGDLYKALWRPEELGATRASELIEPLTNGLQILIADKDRLQEFNPENGWGNYEGLFNFVIEYLSACRENPNALIQVSR